MRAGAIVFFVVCAARAQEVPDFARNKPLAPNLEHKDAGNHVEGIPLIGYDSNIGFGLGVGGFYTMNGQKSDPLFRVEPYQHRFFVQAWFTTGGFQQHMLTYDAPYIGGTPYRIRAAALFERNIAANYFGVGERTLAPLESSTNPRYYNYQFDRPTGSITLERDLLGGVVRALYGVTVQYVGITRFQGTKLDAECRAGTARGCDGGWNDALKIGIAFDTRDFEPDPHSGVFADATGEWAARGFGSAYDYVRFSVAGRFYWSLLPRKWTELVLASRLFYQVQTANAPFYTMSALALTDGNQEGLGGENTLRGYRQDRFVGPVVALAQAELRWTFVRFSVLKQKFSLQIAPTVDAGRVYDRARLDLTNFRASYGGALRVGWNQTTFVRFDFSASREDVGFYIDFAMPY